MVRAIVIATAAFSLVSAPSYAQGGSCADLAGNYTGMFKGATKVMLVVEASCKLTTNGGSHSGTVQGAIKDGKLVAKDSSFDLKLTLKGGKLDGELSFGAQTDRNISFAKGS